MESFGDFVILSNQKMKKVPIFCRYYLRKNGVTLLDRIKEYEGLGKFLHILDIDGRRAELWEPEKDL